MDQIDTLGDGAVWIICVDVGVVWIMCVGDGWCELSV